MNSLQYVMANIQIPIQINGLGKTEILIDYMAIAIEKCENLPEKTIENVHELSLIDQINTVLIATAALPATTTTLSDNECQPDNSNEGSQLPVDNDTNCDTNHTEDNDPQPAPQLFLSREEIGAKRGARVRQNTTFKNKNRTMSRYSVKNR